eukprot:scaffold74972_cov15-Tisochrysis_lutea.AAC.1
MEKTARAKDGPGQGDLLHASAYALCTEDSLKMIGSGAQEVVTGGLKRRARCAGRSSQEGQ